MEGLFAVIGLALVVVGGSSWLVSRWSKLPPLDRETIRKGESSWLDAVEFRLGGFHGSDVPGTERELQALLKTLGYEIGAESMADWSNDQYAAAWRWALDRQEAMDRDQAERQCRWVSFFADRKWGA